MEILPDDIIQLVFYSALFLMVISVPKIVILLGWLGVSYLAYVGSGKRRNKALKDVIGEAGLQHTDSHIWDNLVRAMSRTASDLKEPIVESVGSLILILMTVPYLALGPQAIGFVQIIIVGLVGSIIAGVIVFGYLMVTLRPYMAKVFNEANRGSKQA